METKHKIAKYAGIVIVATIFCRILGLVREVVISNKFGATIETDAFFIAFMIPNLFRTFLGEGALNTAFIPIFAEYLTNYGRKKAEYFASNVLNILILILIIVIVLGIWGAPLLIDLMAVGFKSNSYKYELAVNLTRIMFPYLGFVAIAALFMSILNSYDHFLVPALAPAMLNISIIIFAFTLSLHYGIYSLAIGVILGGLGQALIQVPALVKDKVKYKFVIDFQDPGVQKLLKLLLPAIFGLAINEVNVVVDRTIASSLVDGSISALYYANRLVQFPLGAFGIAISIAIFPTLSKYAAEDNILELKKSFLFGLRMLTFITVPSAVGLIVLRDPIIRLIYEHGIFSKTATLMTTAALLYYSIGLFAYASLRLITMVFYALRDTKTPVKIGSFIVFLNIALDLFLVRYLAHSGLALATSVVAIINMFILLKLLPAKIGDIEWREEIYFLSKIIVATLIMAISCIMVSNFLGGILNLSNKVDQLIQVLISILAGGIIYLVSSYFLGVSEIKNLKQKLKIIFRGKI